MRRMSFSLTKEQLLAGKKTVTRRLGWRSLKAGDHVLAVEKCMGLRRGEKQKVLCEIEIVEVNRERLSAMTQADCAREGFQMMSAGSFVEMFCKHMRCTPKTMVTRIEFRKVDRE